MKKFIIEREIPGAGRMTAAELQAVTQKSCSVLRGLGPDAQWLESFVTDDKVYCVYLACDADMIRRHAELGGFPADRISEVRAIIDPSAA
jgi:hypothetical protein